ncbi:hypothetical protein BC332_28403 [Capsicum chinense]|nr:hypothetical protein BC332_28403 [Capsicum chinense]
MYYTHGTSTGTSFKSEITLVDRSSIFTESHLHITSCYITTESASLMLIVSKTASTSPSLSQQSSGQHSTDVPTRWNSTYLMLNRDIEYEGAILTYVDCDIGLAHHLEFGHIRVCDGDSDIVDEEQPVEELSRHTSGSGAGNSKSELDKYLAEDIEVGTFNFNVLLWWKYNSARFFFLSEMARDILAIPISSVASECAFSTEGRVLDSFRSSLTFKLVEALTKVDPTRDVIYVNGNRLRKKLPSKVYLALNKPKGYICSSGEKESKSVMSLFDDFIKSWDKRHPGEPKPQLFIVGRLDVATTGASSYALGASSVVSKGSLVYSRSRHAHERLSFSDATYFGWCWTFDLILLGLVSDFKIPKGEDPSLEKYQFQWLYTNGLLGVIFSFALLYTSLKSRKARSWWYGTGWFRSFVADYGVPLMVLVWSALSYEVPSKVPSEFPEGSLVLFLGNLHLYITGL